MIVNAEGVSYEQLNRKIRECSDKDIIVENCMGHRYIGAGICEKNIIVQGVPGNAMGAYLHGGSITVMGNAQDAAGDTMNSGVICVHGSVGDAAGYAMRGGTIYIRDDAGYRAGVHMKAYMDSEPVMIIGGCVGSFLGEYQAGGRIIVMNLREEKYSTGNFCGTGMHGGKIYIRGQSLPEVLPVQVTVSAATAEEIEEIQRYVEGYCSFFGGNPDMLMQAGFHTLKPDEKQKYTQIYVDI